MSDWLTHPAWAPALFGGWLLLTLVTGLALQRARRVLRRLGVQRPRAGAARDALLLAAALLLAVALLGPRFGTRRVEVPGHGIDVVLLLDVSRSMEARDTPPTRLVRAREAALGLLRSLGPGDRAALAVFAGHAALLTPLTADHRALAEMLPALDTDMMSDRGSELARGVSAALGAFDPQSLRPGVIVALGDGERGWRVTDDVGVRLRRGAVRFVAGAIGSDEGSPIEIGGGLLRDASGDVIHSRRDPRGFARLAEASGGALLLADAWGSFAPDALAGAAREGLVPGPGGTVQREVPVTHTGLFAGLAFLLLVAEALVDSRRLRRVTAGAGLATLLVAAMPVEVEEHEAHVRRHPDDARALVALGVARARAGDPEEAARAFAAAAVRAKTREEAALASYDLGVARLEAGDFAGARDAFFDATALAPGDRDARFNLEWALRALAAEPPPAPMQSNEPGDEPPADDARSETEPEDSPPDEPEAPEPTAATETLPRSPAALSPDEISRWLEAVEDHPEAAFRAALEEDGRRRSGPQW
jgi:Ca-activated chloride channel family protein